MSYSRDIEDIYPLSPMQQGMLFHSLYAPESGNYYEQVSCTFLGDLDLFAFRRAWQQVIARHPVLRSGFVWEEVDQPLQVVQRVVESPLQVLDWSDLAPDQAASEFQRLLLEQRSQGFDLAEAPLLHLTLVRTRSTEPGMPGFRHLFALGHHHLLLDGWSTPLLLGEFFRLYQAYALGQDLYLPPVRPFREYIAWLKRQDMGRAEAFWRRTLAGLDEPARLDLPAPLSPELVGRGAALPDRPQLEPAAHSYKEHASLPASASDALRLLAQREGLTLNTLVQGAWALLLQRYTGTTDVIFGATVSGRPAELPGAEQMVGLFINTLPVRCQLDLDQQLLPWLKALQLQQLELREYEYTPLVQIQEWSSGSLGNKDGRGTALFESILVFENYPVNQAVSEQGGSLQVRDVQHFSRTNYPLTLVAAPGAELGFIISYDPARYDAPQVRRMLQHLCNLLQAMAADPLQRLGHLEMLSPAERALLLAGLGSGEGFPADKALVGVHQLFETQARLTPDALALRDLGYQMDLAPVRELSYAELERRANQLAHYLLQQGVKPESLVGVCLHRSLEMVIALLAVHKAGGALLPLDPAYPPERLEFMLADAQVQFLITTRSAPVLRLDPGEMPGGTGQAQSARVLFVEELAQTLAGLPETPPHLSEALRGESLAYVIYTSGSTGQPKGVMVEHHSLLNHIRHIVDVFDVHPGERMLQLISLSFDPALEEIFSMLSRGGVVVLAGPANELTGKGLLELCERERIYAIHAPTALWKQLLAEMQAEALALPQCVRILTLGGEGLPVENVRQWDQLMQSQGRGGERSPQMVNLYGPTETTIVAAYYPFRGLPAQDAALKYMPIGGPPANARLYVLDPQLRPLPFGAPGELYIGGSGVARGYLNRPELTADRFIPDPFVSPVAGQAQPRMYRTGDRVRWCGQPQPGGARLEFLGRLDNQVKLRGFRIELGEIEQALLSHAQVRQAQVVAVESEDGLVLAAYVLPAQADSHSQDASALAQHLSQRLPVYMLPQVFVYVESFPLTPGGKVDRRALARRPLPARQAGMPAGEAEPDRLASAGNQESLQGLTSEILAGIWCDLLHVSHVSPQDDFFALGGHSLLATRLVARLRQTLGVELPLRQLFENATFAALSQRVVEAQGVSPQGLASSKAPAIEPASREHALPLSFSQQRLWFLDQLEPGNLFYNITTAVRLIGKLDVDSLERSLNAVVQRHEALRTHFITQGGVAVQVIEPQLDIPLQVTDLRQQQATQSAADEAEQAARRLVIAEARQPFDLASGPLLRARLLRLSDEQSIAVLIVHHIVTDGWSMGILVRELAQAYRSFTTTASAPDWPPLKVQYADYAAWQRAWLAGENLDTQLAYWKENLAGAPALLELPTDRPRPRVKTANGGVVSFAFPETLLPKLQALSRSSGVTMFMTLLAGFQTLLYRYSGQEDVVVGSAIAGRSRAEIENLIGFFVNTLVLRGDLSGEPSFEELLARVRETCLGAFAHQDVPFEMLVDALQPERNLGYTPLFQVGFDMQRQPLGAMELPGLHLEHVQAHSGSAAFDLLMSLTETGTGVVGSLEYNRDLFDEATVRRMLAHYQLVLEVMTADPELEISAFSLLTPEESRSLLLDWNHQPGLAGAAGQDAGGRSLHPQPDVLQTTIHQLFELRVAENPSAPALEFVPGDAEQPAGDVQRLSYAELDRRASQLARALRSLGVKRGEIVGLAVGRSLDMVVGLLAVLKAGAAYLPLDPNYPPERLGFMLTDVAQTQGQRMVLLTQAALRQPGTHSARLPVAQWQQAVPGLQVLDLDAPGWGLADQSGDPLPGDAGPEDPAYVIYTSGSTGKPKGVVLRHRGLCNLSAWQREAFGIAPGARILQFSALSFDAAVWEVFMALANGATLVLSTQDRLATPQGLSQLLRQAEISHVTLPPAMLRLAPAEDLPALRVVVAAGEACGADLVARWAPGRRFFNAYGPTEATVCASAYLCDAEDPLPPPIGSAIRNARLYVLDPFGQPAPAGVPGELVIGGVGVGLGYLNRPELTEEKFIPDRFASAFTTHFPGTLVEYEPRLYRTGDLVRLRPAPAQAGAAGYVLEFLGRIDQQVKLRGFRIELGEIESALLAFDQAGFPGVQSALVERRGDGVDARLVAFVVLAGEPAPADLPADAPEKTAAQAELRMALVQHLRRTLPEYMLPATYVFLTELPLLPNGKVDRKALPDPGSERPALSGEFVPPRDEIETLLCKICAELLNLDQVGVYDNFFELGGHSLLATQFISRVRENLGVEAPLRLLFEQPNVAGFGAALRELQAAQSLAGSAGDAAQAGAASDAAAPKVTAIARSARRMKRTDLDQE